MPDGVGVSDDRLRRRIGLVAFASTASLAAIVLVTWGLRIWWVGTLGRGDIPMAPSTAILLLAIVWAGTRSTEGRAGAVRVVVGLAVLMSALLAISGTLATFERAVLQSLTVGAPDTGGVPVGQMSPVSAVAFVLTAVALLSSAADQPSQRQLGAIAALIATLLGASVAIGYAIRVPLLYGASVPMAAVTSIAFSCLGIGLLLTGPPDTWPVSLVGARGTGHTTRADGTSSLALGLVVSAAVLAATASYTSQSWNGVMRDTAEDLEAASESRSRDVAAWYRERLGDARMIQDGNLLSDELLGFLSDSASAAVPVAGAAVRGSREGAVRGWMQALRAAYGYRAVVLFDDAGVERLRDGASAGRVPDAALSRALSSDAIVLADIDTADTSGSRWLSVLAPLHDSPAAGARRGVVALMVDARADLFPLLTRWPFRSRSAELLLVRRDGDMVVYLSDLRFSDAASKAPLQLPLATPELAVSKALQGERGPFRGVDYRMARVLAASRAIEGTPWLIVAKEDLDEVYAPFWADVRRASAFAALLILSTAFGLAIVSRQQALARLRATMTVDRARQDSDERLRAAMAASIDGFAIVDEDGRITDSNSQAERMLGWGHGALNGQRLSTVLAPPHDAEIEAALTAGREGQSHPRLETRVTVEALRRDGTRFPAELAVVRIRLHLRMAFSAVLRDISEQVRAEATIRAAQAESDRLLAEAERAGRALLNIVEDQRRTEAALRDSENFLEMRVRQRTAQLEAANRELEAFSYSVSHDLRAPLRAIDGYARMLAEDAADQLDQEGLRRLGVVQREAQRMGALIDDLLRFSRLGRQPLEQSHVDMTSLVREVVAEAMRDVGDRQVDVDVAELPPVEGDRALLRQVWLNLVGNALKFTATRARAHVTISGSQTNGEATYLVRDNGVGFDMKYADKLFGVFHRLHTQDQFEGTGVGLALAQRIVSRHGGRMWATAEVDRGATFSFTVPTASGARS